MIFHGLDSFKAPYWGEVVDLGSRGIYINLTGIWADGRPVGAGDVPLYQEVRMEDPEPNFSGYCICPACLGF